MKILKLNLKRIIAVFCILTIMQSYLGALKNIAIAVENEIEETGSANAMFITGDNTENLLEEGEVTSENAEIEEETETVEEQEENATNELEEETEEGVQEEVEEAAEAGEEIAEEEIVPQVEVEVSSKNSSIYKGYLYANVTSDLKYETTYNTIVTLNITNNEYINEVIFTGTDKIGLGEDVDLTLSDYVYYKTTKISQEEFEDILGEEGSIKLYDSEGNYIDEITSESDVENGCYVYTYAESYNEIIFQLVNPINDGSISISNDKAIKGDLIYTREQISLFKAINTYVTVSMVSGESVENIEESYSINLEETESKMTIEIDNNTLSTESENEISLNIALKTDEERYDLFENPTVEIEFPAAIKTVEIEGISLLYKNGLSLSSWNTYTNDSGNLVLRIEITGSQSVYTPGSATEGTNIAIDAVVTTHRLTSNGTQNLKLTYTNDATDRISYLLEGNDAEYLTLNFTGKEEIITAMSVSNQTTGNSNVTYDEETTIIDINAEGDGQTISITGTLLDNFSSEITNVYIIGRIPTIGNVDAEGYSYGTTFDTTFASAISTNGLDVTIYYSEETDPAIASDSWTTDTSDMAKYKTFKMVVNSEEVKAGDNLSFSYDIYVPEDVGYNMVGFGDYTIFYGYDGQEQYKSQLYELVSEEKELSLDDIDEENIVEVTPTPDEEDEGDEGDTQDETEENGENEETEDPLGEGDETGSDEEDNSEQEENNEETQTLLTIGYKVTQGTTDLTKEDTVFERQIVKYTVVIENTSDETINNLVIKGNAENANMYTYVYYEISDLLEEPFTVRNMEEITDGSITYDELDIEALAPGETATFSYYVITLEKENNNMSLTGNITISSDEIEEQTVQTFSNKIVDAEVSVVLKTNGTEGLDDQDYYTGRAVEFEIYFENLADYDLENFVIVLEYSDGFYYEEPTSDVWFEGSTDYNYYTERSGSTNHLVFEIPYLAQGATEGIYIRFCTSSVDNSISEITYTLLAYAETSNDKYISNDFTRTYSQGETQVESTWYSDTNKTLVENGDVVTFTFKIQNTGTLYASTTITPYFSDGYKIVSASYEIDNGESVDLTVNHNSIFVSESLDSGNEMIVTIVASIDDEEFQEDQNVVEARLYVTGDYFDNFFTDVISYNIDNPTEEIIADDDDEDEDDYNYDADYDEITYNGDGSVNSTSISTSDTSSNSSTNTNTNTNSSNTSTTTNTNSNSNSSESTTNNEENKTSAKYSISGTVWLDTDKDGIMNGEDGIEDINVFLYKASNGEGIDTSNKIDSTTTNSQGKYTFSNVETGSYIIVFEYDNEIYAVTEYQNSKATQAESSNATSKTLTSGEIVAITDTLEITNSNLTNINLGLVQTKTFDLSLSQYVSKVSITNNSGKNNYEYNNETDTKIEVSQKYYTSTVLEITYKIVITNEGDTTGYVNKIVDYLPDGLELSDSNWYEGEDGNVYSVQLLGSEIKAGSSRTVTLTVRKSLASGEASKIVNAAEIAESTNAYGLDDIDSTASNKNANEDDYAKTTITISISTGFVKSVINIISFGACIVVCILVCLYIKKYYNKRRFIR